MQHRQFAPGPSRNMTTKSGLEGLSMFLKPAPSSTSSSNAPSQAVGMLVKVLDDSIEVSKVMQ